MVGYVVKACLRMPEARFGPEAECSPAKGMRSGGSGCHLQGMEYGVELVWSHVLRPWHQVIKWVASHLRTTI